MRIFDFKEHKIFTIYGPYPALREALRRFVLTLAFFLSDNQLFSRGWIEKFDRDALFPSLHGGNKKSSDKRNTNSDDDDEELGDDDLGQSQVNFHKKISSLSLCLEEGAIDEDENYIPPWEENDGYYGLLSRLVKTAAPDLIWSVRASYDTSTLNKEQMVNHYSRNGCFTTKVGLCNSLKNLPWFHSGCADEFYPRCYKVTNEDEKFAFIDDYRLTSCISFIKLVQNRCRGIHEPDMDSILAMSSDKPSTKTDDDLSNLVNTSTNGKLSPLKKVPSSYLEFALSKVEQFTLARDHEDIDIHLNTQNETTDEQWTQFIEQFYAASQQENYIYIQFKIRDQWRTRN